MLYVLHNFIVCFYQAVSFPYLLSHILRNGTLRSSPIPILELHYVFELTAIHLSHAASFSLKSQPFLRQGPSFLFLLPPYWREPDYNLFGVVVSIIKPLKTCLNLPQIFLSAIPYLRISTFMI